MWQVPEELHLQLREQLDEAGRQTALRIQGPVEIQQTQLEALNASLKSALDENAQLRARKKVRLEHGPVAAVLFSGSSKE